MTITNFGQNVRHYREMRQITREAFCEDESELSIRQLGRIEAGKSVPRLSTVVYIAQKLQISVGQLTDGESLELPQRYEELKYLILRTPTYMNASKMEERERQLEEIYDSYYDNLPEDEKLAIDNLSLKKGIICDGKICFSDGILNDYFQQLKVRHIYTVNDLILLEMYLSCLKVKQFGGFFQLSDFMLFMETTVQQLVHISHKDYFLLNNIVVLFIDLCLRFNQIQQIEVLFDISHEIMSKTQDFQKMPILSLLEWKYNINHRRNQKTATSCYEKAVMFAKLSGDNYLEERLVEEWQTDIAKW